VKNKDQKIQAPFKMENFMQSDDMQNYEGLEEDINNLSDDDWEPHLTRQDYEKSLDLEPLFNNEESINNLGEFAYQGIPDSIMVELQQKYNLRPRETNTTNVPPKNILSRNKVNEEVATKLLVDTQASRTKTVETRATQTKKIENIEAQAPTREIEKTTGRF
jgi:hypothetical protein